MLAGPHRVAVRADFDLDVFLGRAGLHDVSASAGDGRFNVMRVNSLFHKFASDNEALKIKDSLMGAKRLLASEVEQLASLPSKEVLIAKMLGTLNAPITNFAGVLAAVPRSLVNVLSAIEKKKSEG